ncbi:MAG TPA: class I SAM-dependent methyltransferase [Thermoleophilaceae bacterium]
MDPRAAQGFSASADSYQEARPSWPPEAIDAAFAHWGLDPASAHVVDVAAGTGRLTAVLAARCPHVIAVEPLAEMRAHITAAEALEGTAEQLPLEDASADAIFVAEAFHWFDQPAALAEFARVLKPRGGLALLWNEHVTTAEDEEAMASAFGGMFGPGGQFQPPDKSGWDEGPQWAPFEPIVKREFEHTQHLTRDGLVKLVASFSFIGALQPEARREVLSRVEKGLAEEGLDEHEQRWRCELYLTRLR